MEFREMTMLDYMEFRAVKEHVAKIELSTYSYMAVYEVEGKFCTNLGAVGNYSLFLFPKEEFEKVSKIYKENGFQEIVCELKKLVLLEKLRTI